MNEQLLQALEISVQQNAQLIEQLAQLVQLLNAPRERKLIFDPNDPTRVVGSVEQPMQQQPQQPPAG